MRLLPKARLIRTGDVDHADWNFGGLLGIVSRSRFSLVLALLPPHVDRLLEVGYGSGVFLPELARRTAFLAGVDPHDRPAEVARILADVGVQATLSQGVAEALPFPDASFDAVVAVSTFEFVTDATAAIREIARVLRPQGRAVVVTPVQHPLLDAALRFATGKSAREDFGDRRREVVPALVREMRCERVRRFPAWSPLPLYRAYRLAPHLNSSATAG